MDLKVWHPRRNRSSRYPSVSKFTIDPVDLWWPGGRDALSLLHTGCVAATTQLDAVAYVPV